MLCLHACVLFYRRKDADGICANAGWHCLCTIKSQNTLENLNPIKLYDFIFFEFPILLFSRFTFVICAFAWIGLAMDGGWNECYTYDVPVISFTFPSIFTFRWIQTRKPGCSITFVIGRKHIDDGFGIYFSRVHMYVHIHVYFHPFVPFILSLVCHCSANASTALPQVFYFIRFILFVVCMFCHRRYSHPHLFRNRSTVAFD